MRFFFVVAIAFVVLAQAQKGGKGKGGKGGKGGREGISEEFRAMCADPEILGAICVAGTDLGAKMEVAMAECSGTSEVPARGRARKRKPTKGKGRGRGKGKAGKGSKGDKCPSFEKLMEKIDAETADHRCMMEMMGWMDSDGNMVKDVHDADMATLNKDLTDKIDEQKIEDCSNKVFENMSKKGEKCASSYDDGEREALKKIGMKIAQSKCAQKVFMKACAEYVQKSFMDFMVEANKKGSEPQRGK